MVEHEAILHLETDNRLVEIRYIGLVHQNDGIAQLNKTRP